MPLSWIDEVTIRDSAVENHWVPVIYKVLPLPSKKIPPGSTPHIGLKDIINYNLKIRLLHGKILEAALVIKSLRP